MYKINFSVKNSVQIHMCNSSIFSGRACFNVYFDLKKIRQNPSTSSRSKRMSNFSSVLPKVKLTLIKIDNFMTKKTKNMNDKEEKIFFNDLQYSVSRRLQFKNCDLVGLAKDSIEC